MARKVCLSKRLDLFLIQPLLSKKTVLHDTKKDESLGLTGVLIKVTIVQCICSSPKRSAKTLTKSGCAHSLQKNLKCVSAKLCCKDP